MWETEGTRDVSTVKSHTGKAEPRDCKRSLGRGPVRAAYCLHLLIPTYPKTLTLTFGTANEGRRTTPAEKIFATIPGKDLVLALRKQLKFNNCMSQC